MIEQPAEAVTAGCEAWRRLRERERTSFADWIAVARALDIGRQNAMQIAKVNRPFGRRYIAAIGQWLRENGLEDITGQERYVALAVLAHLDEIEAWRATLTDEERRRWNHPGAIWAHWRASLRLVATRVSHRAEDRNGKGNRQRYGQAVHWPSSFLERAADAIGEARSNDCVVLARAALEAAIRGTEDVATLLADRSAPSARRQKISNPEPADHVAAL